MTARRNTLPTLPLALLVGLAACGSEAPSKPHAGTAPLQGAVRVVHDTLIPDRFEASGTAVPFRQAQLGSRLMARVIEVTVHEGDQVQRGQILARLDARDVLARREQALAGRAASEAALLEARNHANRIRGLYADSAAPRAQLDQAEAALARAEAGKRQADAAEQEVLVMGDDATIRAPFAGTITRRLLDPGAFAAPGQPLLAIEDAAMLRLAVTAPPTMAGRVRRGQRLSGTIENRPIEAVVEGVVPASVGSLVTVNAVIRNDRREWFPGSVATLHLPLGERRTVLVPRAAVVQEGDLTGIRVRRGSGSELRWVRLGPGLGERVEVVSGLAAGDSILVPGGEP